MMMAACGFQFDVSETVWRGMPGIVKPLVHGRARYFDSKLDRAVEPKQAVGAASISAKEAP